MTDDLSDMHIVLAIGILAVPAVFAAELAWQAWRHWRATRRPDHGEP